MAKFTPKSEQQIVGDGAKIVLAKTGLNDLNPASIVLTILQAMAAEDFAQYYQMLQIIRNYNLDTTTGSDLDNRAFEYGLTRKQPLAASGRVTIYREASFVKISTSFYTGFRSRIAGDTEIFVNNAAAFTGVGQQTLIVGRGTPNEEEVTFTPGVSNPQNFTNYYKITLDVPLTNDHSLEESIILKQGTDTLIASGTVIRVPASGRTPEVSFTTTLDVTILAGDDQVDDVTIICSVPGSVGNVGVNSIVGTTAFSSPPFNGARATNDSAFSNGQDRETDTSLRNRIKNHIQAISQSTKAGIANAIDGLVDSTTAKRVVSSNIILPDNVGLPVKVYIDDGTGFEPTFKEQGKEVIISSARGLEQRLQLDLFPLVKAQLETLSEEPFDMSANGLTLLLNVGVLSETITFQQNFFAIPEAATAEEVVKVINNLSSLIEARTSQVGKRVVINAKADTNEDIQVLGGTANAGGRLNFPTDKVQTFYLYKNDKLLSKDGETAFIDSAVETYDFTGATQSLSITIDGKTANVQTALIDQSDFPSVPAAAVATSAQVAEIINRQIAGAVASSVSGKLRITSNTVLSSASKVKINTSTAQATLGFSTVEVSGKDQDYTLNPDLGVIDLVEPLQEFDLVTAGSSNTRAFLTASLPGNYSFSGGETLVVIPDGGSPQTVTFSAAINQSVQNVVDFINARLIGATAAIRTFGAQSFLEIRTNSFGPTGSIEISSSSTSNSIFAFTADSEVDNILSHTAYQVAVNSGPYAFIEGSTLVIVLDNDNTGKTFIITMDLDSTVTSGTNTSSFGASGLITTFLTNDSIKDFWAIFKNGANSLTGAIEKVNNVSTNVFRYYFKNPAPANFGDFAVGDQASFSNMDQAGNNGNFIISGVVVIATAYPAVATQTVSNPSALSPSVGARYLVNTDANTTTQSSVIDKNVANPTPLTPSVGDRHIVAAGANNVTLANVLGRYTDSNDVSVATVHGNRYIINGVGLNAWAGHNNQIAQYNGVGTPGWLFIVPADMDVAFSVADSTWYQFSSGTGTWVLNRWGGKAGKIAAWSGSAWTFTTPLDKEVRTVTSLSQKHQYDTVSNTWTRNDWGGNANQIAQWSGSVWNFTVPSTNDTVDVTDVATTYQYSGSVWSAFKFWVEVSNTSGASETATAGGSGLIGQRRQIASYNATTGAITLTAPTRATPTVGEALVIIPGTRQNVVTFFSNTKVTSLSTKANIELVDAGTKVQISSKQNGSDGYVQVTGGKANEILQFSNSLTKGLRAYAYYVGLIKLVHSTIYGDEQDFVSFPGVSAAGVKVKILPPTVQEVSVSVNVTLADGISLSNVENEVKTQVISYINSLGVGKPVILANIVELLMNVQGINDISVSTPTSNVIISENELGRTKASLISVNVVV